MPETETEKIKGIANFLRDFKGLMQERQFVVKKNIKNRQALADLGLTYRMREEELYSLKVCNYCNGPNPDRLGKADFWVFGKEINQIGVYIKLQILTHSDGDETAVCLSFHREEWSLQFPFKNT